MYNHILVGTDLSPLACRALKHAVKLAHLFNSQITLLNVHEEFLNKDEMVMSRVSVDNLQESYRLTSIQAKSEIKHLLEDLDGNDIKTNILLREGKASQEILKLSKEIKPNLIIMGANGKDSLIDYILGTTASNVVDKSNYPVLVIPNVKNE